LHCKPVVNFIHILRPLFCRYFGTKNYIAEMFGFAILFQLCNFLVPKFRTKNARVKRWWNWPGLNGIWQFDVRSKRVDETRGLIFETLKWNVVDQLWNWDRRSDILLMPFVHSMSGSKCILCTEMMSRRCPESIL